MPSPLDLWPWNSFLWSHENLEFGLGGKCQKGGVSEDGVTEAIWKLAPRGKNHTLSLILRPETSCNFSNRGSNSSTSSSNWKITSECRPFLLTTRCSVCLILRSQRGEFTGYFWWIEDMVLKKSIFCKGEYLGGGGFLLLSLAQGPRLPVLLTSPISSVLLSLVPITLPWARSSAQAREVWHLALPYLNSYNAAYENTLLGYLGWG